MAKYTYIASYLVDTVDREQHSIVKMFTVIKARSKPDAERLMEKQASELEELPNVYSIHGFIGVRRVNEVTLEDVVDSSLYLKKLNNTFLF